ncbi:MAG TPA: tetratricopeptide repeat protein [Pirellulaceae bacterium]|nr:tetratricopeptide repeat protein [Pirellulaceae bacterium]
MYGLDWLYTSSLAPVLAPVVLAIQIACVIHLLRTGRPYWWLWIIFVIPLIGVAAYIYLEVRPTWGKLDLDSVLWKFKSPHQRIAILGERLEDSSTVKNRLALAAELHEAGQFDRECQVLSEGLRGAFKDDVTLLLRLAEAHLEAGRAAEAQQIVQQVVPPRSPDVQLQHALLKARTLDRLGQHAEAEPLLKELVARKKSEAPRYYYAEFLICQGRSGEGAAILHDILRQYRRGNVVWRHQEKRWFYAAKRLLKAPR